MSMKPERTFLYTGQEKRKVEDTMYGYMMLKRKDDLHKV